MSDPAAGPRFTPVFTRETVPAGLLRDHATRAGVSARLHVLSGTVTYFAGASDDPNGRPLGPGEVQHIAPMERHRVAMSEDASFQIEFRTTEGEADHDIHD